MQTLMLVRHALLVGFSCLIVSSVVLWKMPQGFSLGPAFAQRGRRSCLLCQPCGDFSHAPRQLKRHWMLMFAQLNLTRSGALQSVQRLRERFLIFFFFPRKIGVYFFCVVRTFPVGRIPNGSLVVQLMAHIRLPRGERDIFQPVL